MKRIVIIILCLTLVFTLSACSGNNNPSSLETDSGEKTSSTVGNSTQNSSSITPGKIDLITDTESGEVVSLVTQTGYEGKINVEVTGARFINYQGKYYVVIKTKITWTTDYAAADPYIKYYYSSCKDVTNDKITPCDRMLQADYKAAGYEAFERDFYPFEVSYMKDGTEAEGGFVGHIEDGCEEAVLQLVVTEQSGDQVFCEVTVRRG